MTHVIVEWGFLIVGAFVLSGIGSGAYITAFLADIKGKERYEPLSRLGAHMAWVLAGLSLLLLSLDLGRPWSTEQPSLIHPLNVLNNPSSMISFGALLLTVFFVFAILTSLMWRAQWARGRSRIPVWIIGAVVAVLVAFYPGMVLATSYGTIFWRSPFLPWLILSSAIAGGLSLVGLAETKLGLLFQRFSVKPEDEVLTVFSRYGKYLMVSILVFLVGHVAYAGFFESSILGRAFGTEELLVGSVAPTFWALAVAAGLLIPLGLSYYFSRPKGVASQNAALAAFLLRIVGVAFLWFAILFAGQLAPTFPLV